MKHQEHIFAVPANIVPKADNSNLVPFTVEGGDIFIGQRAGLEVNPNYRQVLPYVLVECNGKLFCYQRTKGIGENRLLGKHSVGLGGHIDMSDLAWSNGRPERLYWDTTYHQAIMRELLEELVPTAEIGTGEVVEGAFGQYQKTAVGWDTQIASVLDFKDKSIHMHCKIAAEGGVEAVHLGCPILISVTTEEWTTAEEELVFIGFMEPQDILNEYDCERWTEILLEDYLYHKKQYQDYRYQNNLYGGELTLKEWFEER
jgi:predicted NUDIX family phosphoesterase